MTDFGYAGSILILDVSNCSTRKLDTADYAHRFIGGRGMVSISFEYRLANSDDITPVECIIDAKSVIRWPRKHATELHIDSGKVVVAGISSGGR